MGKRDLFITMAVVVICQHSPWIITEHKIIVISFILKPLENAKGWSTISYYNLCLMSVICCSRSTQPSFPPG